MVTRFGMSNIGPITLEYEPVLLEKIELSDYCKNNRSIV